MSSPWGASLLSVGVVSAASLAGILTLWFSGLALRRVVFWMVSFAAGSLLGGAFFHLLPEIAGGPAGMGLAVSIWTCVGIILFFLLEKFLAWRHCHLPVGPEHPHRLSTMNLVGDGLHNLLDGLIIGAAYAVDINVGLATTAAVLLHEIPQEIADVGVLVYSGMSLKRALLLNLLSASAAFLGAGLILVMEPGLSGGVRDALLPITAGAFIYIAGSDLIPELHKETSPGVSAVQFALFLGGLGLMLGLRFALPEGA